MSESNGYKIESGVPIPKRRSSRYPLWDMKIGDSFFEPDLGRRQALSSTASNISHRCPEYKFITKREGTGFRVWRIEPTETPDK